MARRVSVSERWSACPLSVRMGAVGKHGNHVPYISRNHDTPHIHAKIDDLNIDGGNINLNTREKPQISRWR